MTKQNKPARPDASVIVPVWNNMALTRRFLFTQQSLYPSAPIETVVIDNGSTDDTKAMLEGLSDTGKIIPVFSETNRGFGGGNNLGARVATSDILIFTQNDVLAASDYVYPLIRTVHQNKGALIGGRLLNYDTGWNRFGDVTVPYLEGWLLACTRVVWDHLGGFDEDYYPCDYEDVDLSYRAVQAGIPLLPVSVPVVHQSGQTGALLSDRRAITEKHRLLFAQKHGFLEVV